MDGGTEIRLFDPRRTPRDWTDLIRPTQCAVFLKSRTDSTPLAPNGQPYPNPDDISCVVFDSLDAAQRFCEAKVEALPHLRCEVYDAQGLAHGPLLVVVHPDFQRKEESGSFWSRRRKLLALSFLLVSLPLLWIGTRGSNFSDVAAFLAFNCILLAARFLLWDIGFKHRERERRRRFEAHRKIERGDA